MSFGSYQDAIKILREVRRQYADHEGIWAAFNEGIAAIEAAWNVEEQIYAQQMQEESMKIIELSKKSIVNENKLLRRIK